MFLLPLLLALSLGHSVLGCEESSGYEFYGELKSSYRLHRERVTWETANRTCVLEGGHLVVIDEADELYLVNLLFGRIPFFSPPMAWGFDIMHVGNTDKAKEGEWLTVLGGSVSKTFYNKWRPGEPNNWGYLEHCGAIDRAGAYADGRCDGDIAYLSPFICEKEIEEEVKIDVRLKKHKTG